MPVIGREAMVTQLIFMKTVMRFISDYGDRTAMLHLKLKNLHRANGLWQDTPGMEQMCTIIRMV